MKKKANTISKINNKQYNLCLIKKLIIALTIIIASPLWGDGRGAAQANEPGSGNALSFDGVNDYVSIGSNSPFRQIDSITYSFWVKLPDTNGYLIMGTGAAGGQGFGGVQMSTTELIFTWTPITPSIDATLLATISIPVEKWTHIAITMDFINKNRALYVNGVEMLSTLTNWAGTPIVDWIPNSSYNVGFDDRIGSRYVNSDFYFQGSLDEIRVWNRYLSQTQIREGMCQKLTGSEPGLIGYWRLDEGSGNTAFDSSPNSNDGTLQ